MSRFNASNSRGHWTKANIAASASDQGRSDSLQLSNGSFINNKDKETDSQSSKSLNLISFFNSKPYVGVDKTTSSINTSSVGGTVSANSLDSIVSASTGSSSSLNRFNLICQYSNERGGISSASIDESTKLKRRDRKSHQPPNRLKSLQRASSLPIFSSVPFSENLHVEIKENIFSLYYKIINTAIENGDESIDLSYLSLPYLPDDIEELKYMVAINHKTISTPAIKLFIQGNLLCSLPSVLYTVKYITVLSLRNNHLTSLSPCIRYLVHLKELSIGGNELKYLPAEIMELSSLSIFSARPNPFYHELEMNHLNQIWIKETSMDSLSILNQLTQKILCLYPTTQKSEENLSSQSPILKLDHTLEFLLTLSLKGQLNASLGKNLCSICHQSFITSYTQRLKLGTLLSEPDLPFLYSICHPNCLSKYKKILDVT